MGIARNAEEDTESFGRPIQNAIGATKNGLAQAAQGLGDKASALKGQNDRGGRPCYPAGQRDGRKAQATRSESYVGCSADGRQSVWRYG